MMSDVCLISGDIKNVQVYTKHLARILEELDNKRSHLKKKIDDIIYSKHKCFCDDIFDRVTGGIYIKDYECQLMDSELKRIFCFSKGNSYWYSCPLDNGLLLRGPMVYYYIVCFKEKGKKVTSKEVEQWRGHINVFLENMEMAIENDFNNNLFGRSFIYLKFILGCFDYLRHLVLHCINAECVLINIELKNPHIICDDHEIFVQFEKNLKTIHQQMHEIVFGGICIPELYEKIMSCCKTTRQMVNRIYSNVLKLNDKDINTKCFRLHREADSFIENSITMKYVADIILNKLDDVSALTLCGVLSGALELTFMLRSYVMGQCKVVFISMPCDYLNRQEMNFSRCSPQIDDGPKYIVIDDNVMTGKTLEYVYAYLSDKLSAKIEYFALLRHPDINRIPQMVAYKKAVDLDFLKKYCLGYLNESPYSKIKMDTNLGGEFLDELGVFTLTGDYFLRFLYKNALFSRNSEVGCYGRKFEMYDSM